MTLYDKLKTASSEEDVKDTYIKALQLKSYQKNLIDIQTKEIWFEAKLGGQNSTYEMFTQLLHYVQDALNKGENIPPFLSVIDSRKAAIMKTEDVLPFLKKKTIKWGKSASHYTQEALDIVSAYIGTYLVSFNIEKHEEEFITCIKQAIKSGKVIRTQITPANLKQVFDKWVEMIGREIDKIDEENYALLFFADIMHDGTLSTHENLPAELLHKNGKPVFNFGNKLYELGNHEGYRRFWSIYQKPPHTKYRDYILERRDSLLPHDERSFKGAFYTPLHVVNKAYEKLNETLGINWQKNYIIWDMCCVVGNLEVKHSNHRNIYMSTLEQEDIDVMKATKTCVAAKRFQYDYLNDDITHDGNIDYSLTNKIPQGIRDAIAQRKKILVLINPPYAESGKGFNAGSNKEGVAKTKVGALLMEKYGKASNELFAQFIARIQLEIPTATIAIFSTLKYLNSTNFSDFRSNWNKKFLNGFIVHSKSFDGLKGNFPIGFLIWEASNSNTELKNIEVEVLNKEATPIGFKRFYNIPNNLFLSKWINRPKKNDIKVIPLKNAISPAVLRTKPSFSSDNTIGHLLCDSNDLQNAPQATALFSSTHGIGHKGGLYVTKNNLDKVSVVFTVRQLVKHTWINHNDQFLHPNIDLSEEFKNDCLIWMLFHGKNLTASANDLIWNNTRWSIVNHFIPFSEEEINSPDQFESNFMMQYLSNKKLSDASEAVMQEGRKIWREYFSYNDERSTRETLKLNRCDIGWYQVRKAIELRNENVDYKNVSFETFKNIYNNLTKKLRPMVYDLGFLKK